MVLAYLRTNHSAKVRVMSEKKVTCDCGKVVRAGTDAELVSAVQQHATEVHGMSLSQEQVLSMAEVA